MALKLRRVVTGHDTSGKAVVLIDEEVKNAASGRPGAVASVVWSTEGFPVDNDGSGRACPSSRTPPMVPQSDRDEVSSMSRHTDGTYSPATGNRPPRRADSPITP